MTDPLRILLITPDPSSSSSPFSTNLPTHCGALEILSLSTLSRVPDLVLGQGPSSKDQWDALGIPNVPFAYLAFDLGDSVEEARVVRDAVRVVVASRAHASRVRALGSGSLTPGVRGRRIDVQIIPHPLSDHVKAAAMKFAQLGGTGLGEDPGRRWTNAVEVVVMQPPRVACKSLLTAAITGPQALGDYNFLTVERKYVLCMSTSVSPENETLRFVDMVDRISEFLKQNGLIPYLIGPRPADDEDETYVRRVYQRLKRAFPGESSVIVSDFVAPEKLHAVFSKTLLNVHCSTHDLIGHSIMDAAAFGVPTLLDGKGNTGAVDLLQFSTGASIACDMSCTKFAAAALKSVLRPAGRPFLELTGRRAREAALSWDTSEWGIYVRKYFLDDMLKNAFRAYAPQSRTVSSSTPKIPAVNKNGRFPYSSPLIDSTAIDSQYRDEEDWPWLSLAEWTAGQLVNEDDSVMSFDLDGVRLVVEQLIELPPYSLASLLLNMNLESEKAEKDFELSSEMLEWALCFISRPSSSLGVARFRLVPSRMSENKFWTTFFAFVRDGVIRLMSPTSPQTSASISSSGSGMSFHVLKPPPRDSTLSMGLQHHEPLTNDVDLKIDACERLVQRDECGRGISPIVAHVGSGVLALSARSLFDAKRVVILTGFPCLQHALSPQETDGPPGAVAIAKACVALGKRVCFVIEETNAGVLRACISTLFPKTRTLLLRSHDSSLTRMETFGAKGEVTLEVFPTQSKFTPEHTLRLEEIVAETASNSGHMIAIERAGPSVDGTCRTMRGRVLGPELLAPLHEMFIFAGKTFPKLQTTGIGDGGNEVGMGSALNVVLDRIPKGKEIACTVSVTYSIVCSVSNWGGHALANALTAVALERGLFSSTEKACHACLCDAEEIEGMLQNAVDAGAADGVTGVRFPLSVDGLPLTKTIEVVESLKRLL